MTASTEWPRLRIEWFDPTRPREIVTIDQARQRFGLNDADVSILCGPYCAGLGPWSMVHMREMAERARSVEIMQVRTLHRYTLDDSIRAAAPDLLAACEEAKAHLLEAHPGIAHAEPRSSGGKVYAALYAAIQKARGGAA